MKELQATFIRTTCGKPFDLRKAAPLVSNVAAPYGRHNFIVFKTGKGFFLKGFNTGIKEELLNAYELISRNEAMQYLNAANSQTLFQLK